MIFRKEVAPEQAFEVLNLFIDQDRRALRMRDNLRNLTSVISEEEYCRRIEDEDQLRYILAFKARKNLVQSGILPKPKLLQRIRRTAETRPSFEDLRAIHSDMSLPPEA